MSFRYPHRTNSDGTIDSICPRCYATIATSFVQQDLERLEVAHVCDPSRLRYFEEQVDPADRKPVKSEKRPSNPQRQFGAGMGRHA